MKQIALKLACRSGDVEIDAFVPFDGAEFCAHRTMVEDSDWLLPWRVTHVRSSMAVPTTDRQTRKQALAVAERLSRECPSAAHVTDSGKRPKRGAGVPVGRVSELVAEIKNSLGITSSKAA